MAKNPVSLNRSNRLKSLLYDKKLINAQQYECSQAERVWDEVWCESVMNSGMGTSMELGIECSICKMEWGD